MGYWVTRVAGYLLSAALSQGGQHRGFLEGGSEKESKAKDFESIPLICGLLVYGNIVGPVLKEYLINLTATVLCLPVRESGVNISWV